MPEVITLLELTLSEVNARFGSMRKLTFFTEAKIGYLEVLWPANANVKPCHREFILNNEEHGLKLGMELFAKLQMSTYFLYPDCNLNYRARDEVELVLTYLRTVSKTYSTAVAEKGKITMNMFYINSE